MSKTLLGIMLSAYLILPGQSALAYSWQKNEPISPTGLHNPLELNPSDLAVATRAGRYHALQYPITITGALIPERPVRDMLNGDTENPFRRFLESLFKRVLSYKSFDHLLDWLGLHKYPTSEGEGPYNVPFSRYANQPSNIYERMGYTRMKRHGATGFTYSCATCHSTDLFGRKIIGLQNRFPRANQIFIKGKKGLRALPSPVFRLAAGATPGETKMYQSTRHNMEFVETIQPLSLGLDTSLAHVALSLSHRAKDELASKVKYQPARYDSLRKNRADSKPGTWWNVKYKNRWLLDGSVVSGNPVFTNILWNELGRATDLNELEKWLFENEQTVAELTAAVYSSEAPHITDFFPAERIDLESAKRGQAVYQNLSCNQCHGQYLKNWDLPGSKFQPLANQLKTYQVEYFEQTPVKDVGTDPERYKATQSLVQLNDLRISQRAGAVIEVQKGYVPPPLVGIWARWPYFHNNSVQSLCEVLTPEHKRAKSYWAGAAKDKETDFDFTCNGYPNGNRVPKIWKADKEFFYSATVKGQLNIGHSDRILVKDGVERMTPAERQDLIHFLQTL